jgi:tetratricopeptide (TPR) repeat protein
MVSLLVFAVSVLFVIGGATIGGAIAKKTNISYVEVRPSLEATADIARNVYKENAFLGIGTNKFTDAWRLYKDDAINLTPFWSTDFNAGNGYVTTFFVTTGVLGGIAWLVFLVTFLVTGIRKLLTAPAGDKMWFFIGVSSFVSAVYIWGMTIVYVPGVVILLLGALCTGVSLSALNVLGNTESRVIAVGTNRRTGFVLTLVVITIIIGSVSLLYVAGRHYSSVYTFNESLLSMQQGKAIEELERQVQSAYQLSSSDVFARRIAEYQLARMNNLIALTSPTEEDQKQFQNSSIMGINAAQQATQIDRSEPANWSVLGGIYGALASVGVEGAREKAIEAFTEYKNLNPKSPLPYLELAITEGRANNFDAARSYTEEAIAHKSDFTEAFFFLSQLEIATGNVDAAIRSTQATITLEPQNPVRYYQLGVLLGIKKDLPGAVSAFERAVTLDANYSNARYLLALAYDELGKSTEAKEQLQVVLNLNPGNAEVANLISVIESEGSLKRLRTDSLKMIPEVSPVTDENGTVSTKDVGDSPLVTPVNTAPKVEETGTVE